MARPRSELHTLLQGITANVYFQPPNNLSIQYPCVVYERSRIEVRFADNNPYKHTRRYTVTVINRDPDNTIVDAVSALPLCTHDRFFTADNLNHDVFTLYF